MNIVIVREGWKYIASTALLIAAIGFAGKSMRAAHAEIGPSISKGSNPYASFYGQGIYGTTILTVPSDSAFIVTTFLIDHNSLAYSNQYSCELHIDGSAAVVGSMVKNFGLTGNTDTMSVAASSFVQGNAHLVIPAGSTISIGGSSCNTRYYLEGYYVHP